MRVFYAACLVGFLGLTGCGFVKWTFQGDPATGEVPINELIEDAGAAGLGGLEKGGIMAGAAALLFTSAKTGLRLWNRYQATKKAVEAVLPAPAPEVKP